LGDGAQKLSVARHGTVASPDNVEVKESVMLRRTR
jgi:hypothetical protein